MKDEELRELFDAADTLLGGSLFFDRDGKPITGFEWARIKMAGKHRVASTRIKGRRGEAWVSTVHLGYDGGFGFGPPLLFETMVFWLRPEPRDVFGHLEGEEQERSYTEQEALEVHQAMVLEHG